MEKARALTMAVTKAANLWMAEDIQKEKRFRNHTYQSLYKER